MLLDISIEVAIFALRFSLQFDTVLFPGDRRSVGAYPPLRHYVISRYSIAESLNSYMSYLFDLWSLRTALDKPGLNGEAAMKKFTFVQRLVLALIPIGVELVRLAEIIVKNVTINYRKNGCSMGFQV